MAGSAKISMIISPSASPAPGAAPPRRAGRAHLAHRARDGHRRDGRVAGTARQCRVRRRQVDEQRREVTAVHRRHRGRRAVAVTRRPRAGPPPGGRRAPASPRRRSASPTRSSGSSDPPRPSCSVSATPSLCAAPRGVGVRLRRASTFWNHSRKRGIVGSCPRRATSHADVSPDRPSDPPHPEPHVGALGAHLNRLRAGSSAPTTASCRSRGSWSASLGRRRARPIATAGLAGLVAGAVSMALGEYVSVSGQRDAERAQLAQERRELREDPEEELAELAGLYEAKGLSPATARTVAEELTEHDALRAHLDAELGLDPDELTSPWQAAASSALSFTLGALLPLLAILLPTPTWRVPLTVVVVLLALASPAWAVPASAAPPPLVPSSGSCSAVPSGSPRPTGSGCSSAPRSDPRPDPVRPPARTARQARHGVAQLGGRLDDEVDVEAGEDQRGRPRVVGGEEHPALTDVRLLDADLVGPDRRPHRGHVGRHARDAAERARLGDAGGDERGGIAARDLAGTNRGPVASPSGPTRGCIRSTRSVRQSSRPRSQATRESRRSRRAEVSSTPPVCLRGGQERSCSGPAGAGCGPAGEAVGEERQCGREPDGRRADVRGHRRRQELHRRALRAPALRERLVLRERDDVVGEAVDDEGGDRRRAPVPEELSTLAGAEGLLAQVGGEGPAVPRQRGRPQAGVAGHGVGDALGTGLGEDLPAPLVEDAVDRQVGVGGAEAVDRVGEQAGGRLPVEERRDRGEVGGHGARVGTDEADLGGVGRGELGRRGGGAPTLGVAGERDLAVLRCGLQVPGGAHRVEHRVALRLAVDVGVLARGTEALVVEHPRRARTEDRRGDQRCGGDDLTASPGAGRPCRRPCRPCVLAVLAVPAVGEDGPGAVAGIVVGTVAAAGAAAAAQGARGVRTARAARGATSAAVHLGDRTSAPPTAGRCRRRGRAKCPALFVGGDETAAEALGDGLGPVGRRELAEQAAGVGLDGVLGQVELAPDLAVALALAHPAQDLHLALGEVDRRTGARRGALGRQRAVLGPHGRVGERGDQLGARGVPAQVAAGAARDRGGDAAGVVRGAEHHDVGLRVGGHEATGGLGARGHRALGPDEHDVDGLARVAGEQVVRGRDAVDALHAGHGGHDAGQSLTDTAAVVADQNGPHAVLLAVGCSPPVGDALPSDGVPRGLTPRITRAWLRGPETLEGVATASAGRDGIRGEPPADGGSSPSGRPLTPVCARGSRTPRARTGGSRGSPPARSSRRAPATAGGRRPGCRRGRPRGRGRGACTRSSACRAARRGRCRPPSGLARRVLRGRRADRALLVRREVGDGGGVAQHEHLVATGDAHVGPDLGPAADELDAQVLHQRAGRDPCGPDERAAGQRVPSVRVTESAVTSSIPVSSRMSMPRRRSRSIACSPRRWPSSGIRRSAMSTTVQCTSSALMCGKRLSAASVSSSRHAAVSTPA
ncbi:hypothetical protein L7F22_061149 [Adiantum nelumboides]|nr:hypothetical protein [Adiantum nelumboides]